MKWWWMPRPHTLEAVERARRVNDRADDTFQLLAQTVVRLHRTTKELETALKELNHDGE